MNGEIISALYNIYLSCDGVYTDTRNPISNGLFVSLSGPNFNGNDYADKALSEGAKYVVIDDERYKKDERYVLVKDGLETLQQLAAYHRSKFTKPLIALTGSNGKTSTKELITEVLKTKFNVVATVGNLNNHIGVPLTLLRIKSDTEMAVIEMGANHQGEIEFLCGLARPTHGLITNIGKAHIEGFGGLEGIKKGKGEMYDFLFSNGGKVFFNTSDPVLSEMASRFIEPITYPQDGDDCRLKLIGTEPFVQFESSSGIKTDTHLIGEYNFINAATAYCIGMHFGISELNISEAISGYVPSINRSQIVEKGSNTILLDAYNANPDSMKAAITAFGAMKGSHKVIILGDMLELGNSAIDEHIQLGRIVSDISPDEVYFCGELVSYSAKELPDSHYFETKSDLATYLKSKPINDSTVLIKASRGLGLETLLEVL